jgi:signal peptidase I
MPWNYKPWGCGSGSKGSCNNGWIQFEICEDDLTNETYFNQVYKEACELTAYLCYKFDIDPFGTVSRNGVKVPTILCHKDSYNLKMGSNHGDVLHWFTKFGKTMEDVRKDVAALIPTKKQEENIKEDKNVIMPGDIVKIKDGATYYRGQSIPSWVMKLNWIVDSASGDCAIINKSTDNSHSIMSPIHINNLIKVESSTIEPQIFYYVRTSWDDLTNGKGNFQKEENAIEACKQAGIGYSVFDSNGKIIFSTPELSSEFKIGDEVSIKAGAKWTSGATIPNWVFKSKLYIRAIRPAEKTYVLSTQKSGAVTGVIAMNSV